MSLYYQKTHRTLAKQRPTPSLDSGWAFSTLCWPISGIYLVRVWVNTWFGWKQFLCNCSHILFWKTHHWCFAGFFVPSCSVEILSVTGRTPGDASVSPVSSAPRLHLSSRCLRCPEDVTWPTPGNSSLGWFQTVLCVLLQVLKDRSPLLSWLRLAFTPASKQPALSNKMSPHKMNMSRRLGVYQTSYR